MTSSTYHQKYRKSHISYKENLLKIKSVVLVLLILFLTACGVDFSIGTGNNNINKAVGEIADFDLPAGYHADFSTKAMGYTAVSFSGTDHPSHLYLIQSENKADEDKLTQALDELVIGSGDPDTNLTVVETRGVIVRGQETEVIISDSVNSEGTAYRQAAVSFHGNGGPALLVFSEPLDNWDQTTLDSLLASIR
jgi:hypothetical protein